MLEEQDPVMDLNKPKHTHIHSPGQGNTTLSPEQQSFIQIKDSTQVFFFPNKIPLMDKKCF